MNVPGPSRVRQTLTRENIESTYEQDLLGLLSQLSPDEMDEIQTFFVHRTDAGQPLSDHDVAMNDLLQQARALELLNEDRALAQRIAAGEDVHVNQVLDPPRAGPQRNGNQQQRAQDVRNNTASSQTWGGWLSTMVDWAFRSSSITEPGSASTNPDAPKPSMTNRPTGHDCVICQDPIYGAEVRAPCGHYYDIDCITDLCRSATKDETLFPPRCCRQNIPITLIRSHLSQTLLATLQEKHVEFSTLKRVYCSSQTCSRFLGALSEGIFSRKVYTCPAPGCARRTCGKCRGEHTDNGRHVCRPDADVDTAQVLELSRTAGWARCPGCAQMIELHLGCFHMTCRCRTEFCYLCRARWKTCRCPQWDEHRLMAAAEERVDARLGVAAGAPRGHAVRPAQPAAPAVPRRVPIVDPAPGHAPVPAPTPGRRPLQNPLANHTQQQVPGTRAGVTPPAPARVQRQQPTATVPAPAPVPGSLFPTQPPQSPPPPAAITQSPRLRSILVRAPAVGANGPSTSTPPLSTGKVTRVTGRPSSILLNSTSTSSTNTSTSTPTRASTSGWMSTSSTGQPRPPPVSGSIPSPTDIDTTRQRMVREMMDRLRIDHECNHTQWRYRSGGGICQSCGHRLPLYLFRCHGCEMLACNRCRRNRL